MNIYLIRHGQTVSGLNFNEGMQCPDPALDEMGKEQAILLGQRMQRFAIRTIYSSDLERTRQTAQILNRFTYARVVPRPELREINMGEIWLKGWQAFPEFSEEWSKHEADLPYPRGECGADVMRRIQPVIDDILAGVDENVAIVTHGGVIMVLLSAILGMSQEKRFQFAPVANCSISTLIYDREHDSLKVSQVNDIAHLER